jgi:predicted transcriptional regulator
MERVENVLSVVSMHANSLIKSGMNDRIKKISNDLGYIYYYDPENGKEMEEINYHALMNMLSYILERLEKLEKGE